MLYMALVALTSSLAVEGRPSQILGFQRQELWSANERWPLPLGNSCDP
jgi:hypothetical protein